MYLFHSTWQNSHDILLNAVMEKKQLTYGPLEDIKYLVHIVVCCYFWRMSDFNMRPTLDT